MLLSGKVAMVAGIGAGLGRASTLALARAGADIIMMARSDTVMKVLQGEIEALGRRVLAVCGDITDTQRCNEAVQHGVAMFGGIDILVNNAFYQGVPGPALTADLDDWRRVMEVNFFGALNMTRAVIPAMQQRGGGSIVMVNSDQAWITIPGFGAYAASKGALVNITRTLAAELGPDRIRVNSVHPGMIMAESLQQYFQQLAQQRGIDADQVHREIADQNPLRYIPDADEMAGSVLYLASDLAKPVTGQSIGVNAGACFH